jgi:hypothetical protein
LGAEVRSRGDVERERHRKPGWYPDGQEDERHREISDDDVLDNRDRDRDDTATRTGAGPVDIREVAAAEPVGAENTDTSRDLHILMYQATEAVSS